MRFAVIDEASDFGVALQASTLSCIVRDATRETISGEAGLQQKILPRLLAVSRHLSASADLNEILTVIIDAMRDILDAERATVFEYDLAHNELFTTVAHGVKEDATKTEQASGRSRLEPAKTEIRIPATKGLAGECAQRRSIINVPDAYADPRFNQSVDRETGYRTRSILTIPLTGHDGELVGVAQVLNKRSGVFTADDEEIATALAAQAAVAMKRGRLIEDRLVREKLERDLELARTIQQSSFPGELPQIDGFDIAAWNQPADRTGGDVYDVMIREATTGSDQRSRAQRIILLMADATGHGVGPAISVTQLRSMLRMAVRLGAELKAIAQHVNEQLCADLPPGRFITAWLGELDASEGLLRSLSAGQAPLLHYAAANNALERLEADTLPLGVIPEAEFGGSPTLRLCDGGDWFAVVSDGVFESQNAAGEQYGFDRACACLQNCRDGSAQEMIGRLRSDLDAFTGQAPADDDRTVIIIKRL